MKRRRVSQKPFLEAPFIIVWELIKPPKNDWGALQLEEESIIFTLEQKKKIIDEISDFGKLKLILSGGDLFKENDLLEIIKYAKLKGLVVSLRPTVVDTISDEQLMLLKEVGLDSISVNLDGPYEQIHDSFNEPGSFINTSNSIIDINRCGIPLQINTSLCKDNLPYITELAENIKMYPVVLWNIAMTLVDEERLLSASECELLYHWLYDFSKTANFDIKMTSGPQFHRVIIQNKQRENLISGNYIHYRDSLLRFFVK